jgi:hypothetical protein
MPDLRFDLYLALSIHARAGELPGLIFAENELDIEHARRVLPMLQNRRVPTLR